RRLDLRGIDVAMHRLLGLVAAPDSVDVPVPFASDTPVKGRRAVIGVDLLFEVPRAQFDHAALDLVVIATHAAIVRNEIEAERVERVGSRDRDMVEQIAVADIGPYAERNRRR